MKWMNRMQGMTKRHEWNEMKSNEMKWKWTMENGKYEMNEVNEMKWNEMKWSEVKWNEMERNERKW